MTVFIQSTMIVNMFLVYFMTGRVCNSQRVMVYFVINHAVIEIFVTMAVFQDGTLVLNGFIFTGDCLLVQPIT